MKIRKATKNDSQEILSLDKEAGKEIKWWIKLKKSNLSKNIFYVIEDGKVIGYLRASKKKGFIELEDLFLKKEYRGRGYARKLVLFFMKDIKFKKVKLICPERLRKFNEHLGFRVASLNMEKIR